MRLTTKSRLAVTAMIDLALHRGLGPVPLASISQRQHISISYLEQLFSNLRRHALVASTRGPGGGYTLGRDAAAITVADILFAVDEPEKLMLPGTSADADEAVEAVEAAMQPCAAPELWASLNHHVVEFLDSINLQTLADEQLAAGVRIQEKPVVKRLVPALPKRFTPPRDVPNSVFALGTLAGRAF